MPSPIPEAYIVFNGENNNKEKDTEKSDTTCQHEARISNIPNSKGTFKTITISKPKPSEVLLKLKTKWKDSNSHNMIGLLAKNR